MGVGIAGCFKSGYGRDLGHRQLRSQSHGDIRPVFVSDEDGDLEVEELEVGVQGPGSYRVDVFLTLPDNEECCKPYSGKEQNKNSNFPNLPITLSPIHPRKSRQEQEPLDGCSTGHGNHPSRKTVANPAPCISAKRTATCHHFQACSFFTFPLITSPSTCLVVLSRLSYYSSSFVALFGLEHGVNVRFPSPIVQPFS